MSSEFSDFSLQIHQSSWQNILEWLMCFVPTNNSNFSYITQTNLDTKQAIQTTDNLIFYQPAAEGEYREENSETVSEFDVVLSDRIVPEYDQTT